MPTLRLAEADRDALAAYNIPEVVPYTLGRWGMKAIGELRRQTGYTYARLEAGLDGITYTADDGSESVETDVTAFVALCWLILWDSGYRIPWKDFDLRFAPRFVADDVEAEADEGKAPAPDGLSTPTGT